MRLASRVGVVASGTLIDDACGVGNVRAHGVADLVQRVAWQDCGGRVHGGASLGDSGGFHLNCLILSDITVHHDLLITMN